MADVTALVAAAKEATEADRKTRVESLKNMHAGAAGR
jgi:hypothetical protein